MAVVVVQDLIDHVAVEAGITKRAAKKAVLAVIAKIYDSAWGGHSVVIKRFGTFVVRRMGPRVARDPKTGGRMPLPARRVLSFHPPGGSHKDLDT